MERQLKRHFTTYVEEVNSLIRESRLSEAIELLNLLIEATENEDKKEKSGVAPWYYNRLATVYRKLKKYDSEIEVLERYDRQRKAPGVMPLKLKERLIKRRILFKK